MPRLIVHPGTPQAWEIQLKRGTNYLGRAVSNDSKIEAPSVSSVHCQILVSEGWAMIKDLGSTNGTFVGRAPVQEAQLQSGQTIHLGDVEMLFDDEPALQTAPAPAPTPLVVKATAPAPQPLSSPPPVSGGTARMERPLPPPPAMRASPAAAPSIVPAHAATSAPAASKPAVCRYHPHDPARWLCGKCQKTFCDLCVATRRENEEMKHFCRTCGAECSEMEIKIVVEEEKSFFQVLPGAFVYPFRKEGILIFIIVGILLVGFDFLASLSKYATGRDDGSFLLRPYALTAFYLRVLFWGYLFAYMQNIIQSTASGDQSQPEMPAVSEFFSDIIVPIFQLAVICAVSFGPAIILTVWVFSDQTAPLWAIVPVVGMGCLYFPMAFLAVAMYDTVAAINPLLVVPSIVKVPLQYVIVCVVFGTVLVCRWLFNAALLPFFPVAGIPVVISGFLGLYLLTVAMRILGLLYLTNKGTFAWFKR